MGKKDYDKWVDSYGKDYINLFRESCVCCGENSTQFDHIIPQIVWKISPVSGRWKRYNQSCSVKVTFRLLENGNLQSLCATCNMSKGAGHSCYLHNKYLGIWNYLIKLDDLEK